MVSSWAGRILPALVDGRKAAGHDGIPPWEVLVVRFASALFLISSVALATSKPEPGEDVDGRALFRACHFKAAARIFEEAPLPSQNSACLHFWAGRSYPRLGEMASPSSTHKNADKAHRARIAPQPYWGASTPITAARQHDDAGYEFTGAGSAIKGGVRRLGSLIGRLLR